MKGGTLGLILLAALLAPAVAPAQSLDAARFEQMLGAARAYAADKSLLFYCLRYTREYKPFLYAILVREIEEARVKLKAADADDRQQAVLVQTVLDTVRFYPPDAKDSALDRRCVAEEVEKNYAQLGLISWSLAQRPAFRTVAP